MKNSLFSRRTLVSVATAIVIGVGALAGLSGAALATDVKVVLKGDDAWAARILGARDAVTERTGATAVDHSVHDLQEQAERGVRNRLGPERSKERDDDLGC